MTASKTYKVIIVSAALVVLVGIAINSYNQNRQNAFTDQAGGSVTNSQTRSSTPHQFRRLKVPAALSETLEQSAGDEAGQPKLPREEVEKYLERNRRSADSLLAAFRALSDTNYLKEAATKFSNDPRVQLSVLVNDAFPEERHKWLDLFNASSPDNSLANYLTARELFKSGQTEAAVNELLDATSKPGFKDYVMEARLDNEALNMAAGRSPLESRMSPTWANDLFPELLTLKGLARDMAGLQKEYLKAGDMRTVEQLTQMGSALAARLNTGDTGKFIMDHFVANSIQCVMLQQLDQNTSYDFLGGKTPSERQAEIIEQSQSLKTLVRNSENLFSTMSEAELLGYFDRQKLYGEAEAMRWLKAKQPPP